VEDAQLHPHASLADAPTRVNLAVGCKPDLAINRRYSRSASQGAPYSLHLQYGQVPFSNNAVPILQMLTGPYPAVTLPETVVHVIAERCILQIM
jgi:hypothetical protein